MPLSCRSALAGLAGTLLLLTGCATYNTAYVFDALSGNGASVPGAQGDVGRVDATILGVRDATPEGRPAIDVRYRVERFGATPVVPSESLRLVTGNLQTIDAGAVRSIGPRVPASGGAVTFEATFTLPGRKAAAFDLSGLALLVPLDVAGRPETVTLSFSRNEQAYFWPDPWGWPGCDTNGIPVGFRR